MTELPVCECAGPGFCERFQQPQQRRAWELCSGKCAPERPCDRGIRAAYLRRWAKQLARACETVPPLIERLANAGKAFARAARAGFVRVPQEVVLQRELKCRGCEMRDAKTDRCKHPSCGCPLSSKGILLGTLTRPGKLEIATESCPLGLWPQWTPPEGVNNGQ